MLPQRGRAPEYRQRAHLLLLLCLTAPVGCAAICPLGVAARPSAPARSAARLCRRLQNALQQSSRFTGDLRSVASCVGLPAATFRRPPAGHYEELMRATAPFRGLPVMVYRGYEGPWLENTWISAFCCDKPSEAFLPLTPIFVQWMDLFVGPVGSVAPPDGRELAKRVGAQGARWGVDYAALWRALKRVLLPDVAYVTVSAHDFGIGAGMFGEGEFRNILVLSGGGFGHVPVPLLKVTRSIFAIFLGSYANNPHREAWLRALSKQLRPLGLPPVQGLHPSSPEGAWREAAMASHFCICPRGRGRSAFALAEVIQLGCLPVYIFDDEPWLPYQGSADADWSSFGLAARATPAGLQRLAARMDKLWRRPGALDRRRTTMRKLAASHFTHAGVAQQIGAFLAGSHNSSLRCRKRPASASPSGPVQMVVVRGGKGGGGKVRAVPAG